MREIRLVVPAVPVAQPRQRHRVVAAAGGRQWVQNYTPLNAPANSFKATVRLAAREAYDGAPLQGAVGLEVVFVMPRPGRLRWKTRPMPREFHAQKPDCENLLKSLQDALSGTLYADDAQISEIMAKKLIAGGDEQPHVEITIRELCDRSCNAWRF